MDVFAALWIQYGMMYDDDMYVLYECYVADYSSKPLVYLEFIASSCLHLHLLSLLPVALGLSLRSLPSYLPSHAVSPGAH
jgi:hypothetical protein